MLKVFDGFTIPATELPLFKTDFRWGLFSFKCSLSDASTNSIHSRFPFPSGLRQNGNGDNFFFTGEGFIFVRVGVSINGVDDQKQLKSNRQQTNWNN